MYKNQNIYCKPQQTDEKKISNRFAVLISISHCRWLKICGGFCECGCYYKLKSPFTWGITRENGRHADRIKAESAI